MANHPLRVAQLATNVKRIYARQPVQSVNFKDTFIQITLKLFHFNQITYLPKPLFSKRLKRRQV
jgi:hypothetical protein